MQDFLLSLSRLVQQNRWFRSLSLAVMTFLLVVLMQWADFLSTMEFTALNQAYTHRKNVEVNPDIAYWNMDDSDIEMLRWPWSWDHFAEVVDLLDRYDIKLALFQEDVFAQASLPALNEEEKDARIEQLGDAMFEGPEELKQTIQQIATDPHKGLEMAIKHYPHIMLSQAFVIPDNQDPASVTQKRERLEKTFLPEKREILKGIRQKGFAVPENMPNLLGAINLSPVHPRLQPHLESVGFMRITPDEDGTIRQVPTVVALGETLFFSQPVVAAAHYFGIPLEQLELQPGKLIFRGVEDPKKGGDLEVPIDEQGRMYVNWTQGEQLDAYGQIAFKVVRHLGSWDMSKKIWNRIETNEATPKFDPDDINTTLMPALNTILSGTQTELVDFKWIDQGTIARISWKILVGWIMENMMKNGSDLSEIAPLLEGLLEKLGVKDYDLNQFYSSVYLGILLEMADNDEIPSLEDLLYSGEYNLHPHRTFLGTLETNFFDADDEIMEVFSENELLVVDEDYEGDDTRVMFTNFTMAEKDWITDMVIKTNWSKEEIEKRLLPVYQYMKKRELELENVYKLCVHHKKKGILEQMKPFVFPEPINLGDRTIQLLDYKDKTVFVGLTATGLNALNPTPYKGRYSMASLTPTTFNTLTTANFITRLDIAGPVLIFIYALLVFLLAFYANPIIAFLLTAAMGVGHYFFSSYMFEHQGLIVPIVAPVLSVIAAFLSANIYLYIEQQKERQKIRGMFSAMVSPEVLKIMEEEPDKFNLRGEKVEASMFSSDVSGFTSISEGVTAQELALILNLYLTPMSNLVMTYGGYVEKYEGDAIKADFGMPLPDNDHAWKACFSALLQQEELTVVQRMLQLKYGVMITARMGVNTGVVNAGNMGSINKMQYCALGEEVAMAEELEPSNKMWETWIAISPETLRLSGDCLETRLLDVVEYEHCTIPVYELIGWKEDVFLKFWEGKPIPKLVIEGWERIIPEKILAYIDYYREHRFDGNGFYDLMLSTFEGLEQSSLDFMKLNDRIEVAGLEKRYLALLEMVDAQGVSVSLDDLDPVDRKEMDGLITARDEAQEPWLQLLNGYLVELKMRTHVTLRLGDKLPQDEINEWLTGIDTLEKNSNCYIKRNRFPEENDNYGNQLKEHLVSILPQPSQGLSEEQLESMKAELKQLGQSIKQSMMAFVAKSQSFAAEYHQMMAKHCLYEEQKREVCGIFAQGRELYLERKWDEALTLFQKGLDIDPDDGPCMKFSERCESFKANAPAADWDGTWEADW